MMKAPISPNHPAYELLASLYGESPGVKLPRLTPLEAKHLRACEDFLSAIDAGHKDARQIMSQGEGYGDLKGLHQLAVKLHRAALGFENHLNSLSLYESLPQPVPAPDLDGLRQYVRELPARQALALKYCLEIAYDSSRFGIKDVSNKAQSEGFAISMAFTEHVIRKLRGYNVILRHDQRLALSSLLYEKYPTAQTLLYALELTFKESPDELKQKCLAGALDAIGQKWARAERFANTGRFFAALLASPNGTVLKANWPHRYVEHTPVHQFIGFGFLVCHDSEILKITGLGKQFAAYFAQHSDPLSAVTLPGFRAAGA